LREIVTEWQRRGGCQFVHAEQLPATPLTLQVPAGTPELDAIDSLFRGLATPTSGYGYIVAPATNQAPNKSSCGAVYILAASRPTSTVPYSGAMTTSPIVAPIAIASPDDEIPPVTPFGPIQRPQPVVPGAAGAGTNPTGNPAATQNAPAQPSFAPIAPAVPSAGRIGAPPAPTPAQPNGNPQTPQNTPNGSGR
jgi:hypothetical protein